MGPPPETQEGPANTTNASSDCSVTPTSCVLYISSSRNVVSSNEAAVSLAAGAASSERSGQRLEGLPRQQCRRRQQRGRNANTIERAGSAPCDFKGKLQRQHTQNGWTPALPQKLNPLGGYGGCDSGSGAQSTTPARTTNVAAATTEAAADKEKAEDEMNSFQWRSRESFSCRDFDASSPYLPISYLGRDTVGRSFQCIEKSTGDRVTVKVVC